MNFLFALAIGVIAAILLPHGSYVTETGDISIAAILKTLMWFAAGAFVGTVVRFVGPKREHVITLLGTTVIQTLKTGIRLTLPWPFGWTHRVIHTDVRARKMRVQIKSKDNLVFNLPVTAQTRVSNSLKYAIERDDPDQQMDNLIVAAVRGAGNSMEFQAIYDDKRQVQEKVAESIADQLETFGIEIIEIVAEDPELPESLAAALNGIREAEYDRQAAAHEAEATFIRMVGSARAETESLRLKGAGLANFRLLAAEGNAAAIAVMQGKLAIEWEEETVGEGDNAKTIKKAKFIDPATKDEKHPDVLEIDPKVVLDFFKVIDSNDAIRDAAAKEGTVIIAPAGGQGTNLADIVALAGLRAPAEREAA